MFELIEYPKLKVAKNRINLGNGRELQFHSPNQRTEFPIDLAKLLPVTANGKLLEIEIGPGKGEFIANRAASYTERFFVGIDRRKDRSTLSEKKLTRQAGELNNWIILHEDARCFLQNKLPPIQVLHVYQPDPWPKLRHHKNRFFRSPDAQKWCEAISSGGELRVSTDHMHYFEEILAIVNSWKTFKMHYLFIKRGEYSAKANSHFENIFLQKQQPVFKVYFVKI